jgi:hypothetical protein
MELTIENIIKIIIGLVVVGVVVFAVYYFFKNNVIDFFRNFGGGETVKFFMGLY